MCYVGAADGENKLVHCKKVTCDVGREGGLLICQAFLKMILYFTKHREGIYALIFFRKRVGAE